MSPVSKIGDIFVFDLNVKVCRLAPTNNFNPIKSNEISHSYQMDQSISVSRVVGRYF